MSKVLLVSDIAGELLTPRDVRKTSWRTLDPTINIGDYDYIILDFASTGDWTLLNLDDFQEIFTIRRLVDTLVAKTTIVFFGDPRPKDVSKAGREVRDFFNMLHWTGLVYEWDDKCGDTVQMKYNFAKSTNLARIMPHAGRYEYSLRRAGVDPKGWLGEISIECRVFPLCCTKYGCETAFSVLFRMKGSGAAWYEAYGFPTYRNEVFGPLLFLPEIDLSVEDAIGLILSDICGVESDVSEPEWAAQYSVAGQDVLEQRIAERLAEIEVLKCANLEDEKARAKLRNPVRLLYGTGGALEEAVRDVLSDLGAAVYVRNETNREDGLFTVRLGSEEQKGVLEITGTSNASFSEKKIRQLHNWVGDRLAAEHRPFKGVFFGNSAASTLPTQRDNPFSDSFAKTCVLMDLVAMTTVDLWEVYCASLRKELDPYLFWECLLSKNGILTAQDVLRRE